MLLNDKIDQTIKEVWMNDLSKDYNDNFLLKEDSLKNALYYHLRMALSDGFLKRHRLRIFTEYYLGSDNEGKQQIADLAIVRLRPKYLHRGLHLRDVVEDIVSIIELKYLNDPVTSPFYSDVQKVKKYIETNKFENCRFYLGFIHEQVHEKNETWLTKKEQTTWARGKVSELVANYSPENEEMIFNIATY